MKRILFFLLTLVAALSASAHDFEVNGIYYTRNSNYTVSVSYKGTSYSQYSYEYSGSVTIPPSVTYGGLTYSVTSIGENAFYGCSGLTSVTIPNSVTSIGSWAFYGCRLTSVTIPNSVTSIGSLAFFYCSGLTSVTIGNSVTSIGDSAFKGCSGLKTVNWNAKNCANFSYESTPFRYYKSGSVNNFTLTGITTFNFGNEVEKIPAYLCCGLSGLTSVTIPNSVTSIGNYAFDGCSGLTKVEISDIAAWCRISFGYSGANPLSYAHHLYMSGSEIKDLVIPNSVTSIGSSAFSDCSGLTSVTIPNSVTSIGDLAFSGCGGLTSVTIPNSVTKIGGSAFNGCSGLTSVTIPNSVTSIGGAAFKGCSGLKTVNWNVKNCADFSGSYYAPPFNGLAGITTFNFGNEVEIIPAYLCYGLSGLTSVTIPNSVKKICDYAFSRCSGLTSVIIGNSVTEIGLFAFSYCGSLTSIVVESGNTKYDSRNNCNAIIETSTNNLLAGCKNTTIPISVTSIGGAAFEGCSGLTSVTIPSSVTSIGNYAFYGCSGLKTVNWNAKNCANFSYESTPFRYYKSGSVNNFTLTGITTFNFGNEVEKIPAYLCCGLSGLTSVTIGNSVTSIGNYAFDGCSGLTKVEISDIAAWCRISFGYSGANPLSYAHHLYMSGSEIKDLVIPNSVTSIGSSAFSDCSGLTSVTIPNSVTSIGDFAFSGCGGLTKVEISDISAWCGISFGGVNANPLSYAKHLYLNGNEIKDLVIPDSVTSIGAYAFYNCNDLTSVTIPNSVTEIGGSAFYNCSGLTKAINLASAPQSISSDVFSGVTMTSCNLYVQPSSISRYKIADVWKAFNVRDVSGTGTIVDGIKYADIGDGLMVVNNNYQGNIVIPEEATFKGIQRKVKAIGSEAFYNCNQLTKISIPSSVTDIGENAFFGCDKLTVLNMGDSVRTIGDDAFNGCQHLITVTIPKTLSSLGARAFNGCASLFNVNWNAINCDDISASDYAPFNGLSGITTFNFGNEVEKIPNYLCYGLSGLTSVTIPNSVTEIGMSAFEGCSGLSSVTIPNSVSMINSGTFSGCSGLNSVSIPNSVTSIGSGAFNGCSGLTSITIPNSVTEIDDYTFSGCSGLTSVTIPYYVTSIGSSAFQDCRGLTSITIPNAVTEIDGYAFSGCSGLTSVTVGNSVNSIGENAFDGSVVASLIWNAKNCDSMGEMPKGNIQTVTIGSEVESLPSDFVRGSLIKTVSIPNSVTSIGDSAFSGCGGLTSVTIPNSVKTIGAGAFYGCDGITNLSFDNAPSSIGDEAFSGCTGLTTLSLGNYVTEIGDKAFYGVWRLTSLVIPNSTTKIGSEAFSGLSQLATLTIGNSVSSIGENAFVSSVIVSTLNWNAKRCQSMGGIPKKRINTVIIGNGVEYLPSDFMMGSLINSIYIPNSITEIGKDAFLNCTRLTTVDIYDITAWCNIKFGNSYSNPIVVPHKLFVNGKELKDLIIPKTVTSIGNYAFYFCNSLNSVTFSDSVTKIGAESFRNCNGLASVTIPNSVTSIGNNAFSGCKNITSLFLDNDNFANISAFNDSKTSVSNIYIGKSVSQINANAFSGCSNLLSATICENVSEIGNNAFSGCSKLNEVTNYSEYPQPINETVFSGVNVKACSLYVMENSYYYYSNVVYWKDFLVKITGVEGVEVDEPQKEIEGYYDLKGIRLEKPIRGQVNIVRYTDGSTKKLVVK